MARAPERQAHWAAEQMRATGRPRSETRHEPGKVPSVHSLHNYERSLKQFAAYLRDHRLGDLRSFTKTQAADWLNKRADAVTQKQLDQDRLAISKWLSNRAGEIVAIPRSQHYTRVDESQNLAHKTRLYEPQQADRIQARLTERNELAVQICREAGTRAHEVGTIAHPDEQPPSDRTWASDKFFGKENGVTYTVHGKGGLVREVKLSNETARWLEQHRRQQPVSQQDRGINFKSRYNVGTGQALSQAFTRASQKELGWSKGIHGLRHVYVQDRLDKLQESGYQFREAEKVVAQEVGHFSPRTTKAYER